MAAAAASAGARRGGSRGDGTARAVEPRDIFSFGSASSPPLFLSPPKTKKDLLVVEREEEREEARANEFDIARCLMRAAD